MNRNKGSVMRLSQQQLGVVTVTILREKVLSLRAETGSLANVVGVEAEER